MNEMSIAEKMKKRFGNNPTMLVENETSEYVRISMNISTANLPIELVDDLTWKKEEEQIFKQFDSAHVRFIDYYQRKSRVMPYHEYNFLFGIHDGEKELPFQVSYYAHDNTWDDYTDPLIAAYVSQHELSSKAKKIIVILLEWLDKSLTKVL